MSQSLETQTNTTLSIPPLRAWLSTFESLFVREMAYTIRLIKEDYLYLRTAIVTAGGHRTRNKGAKISLRYMLHGTPAFIQVDKTPDCYVLNVYVQPTSFLSAQTSWGSPDITSVFKHTTTVLFHVLTLSHNTRRLPDTAPFQIPFGVTDKMEKGFVRFTRLTFTGYSPQFDSKEDVRAFIRSSAARYSCVTSFGGDDNYTLYRGVGVRDFKHYPDSMSFMSFDAVGVHRVTTLVVTDVCRNMKSNNLLPPAELTNRLSFNLTLHNTSLMDNMRGRLNGHSAGSVDWIQNQFNEIFDRLLLNKLGTLDVGQHTYKYGGYYAYWISWILNMDLPSGRVSAIQYFLDQGLDIRVPAYAYVAGMLGGAVYDIKDEALIRTAFISHPDNPTPPEDARKARTEIGKILGKNLNALFDRDTGGSKNMIQIKMFSCVDGDVPLPKTPLTLSSKAYANEDQRAAGRKLQNFLRASCNASVCVLTGDPGTGKTTILRRVALSTVELGQSITLTALTNDACTVLQDAVGLPYLPYSTLHSLLGVSIKDGGNQLFPEVPPQLPRVVIIDEASQANKALLEWLTKTCLPANPHTKVLFVGDPFQISPVGEKASTFTSIDVGVHKAHLSEPVRYGGSIEKLVSYLKKILIKQAKTKKCIAFDLRPFHNPEGGVFVVGKDTYIELLKESAHSGEFLNDTGYVLTLARTNALVAKRNALIRSAIFEKLFGEDWDIRDRPWEIGEPITLRKPLIVGGVLRVRTSERCKILSVDGPVKHTSGYLCWELGIDVDASPPVLLHVLSRAGKYQLEEDYSPEELCGGIRKIRDLPRILALFSRPVHTYASTVHKAQGRTVSKVFVDKPNIPYGVGWDQTALQLLYTAVTRASKVLVINNGISKKGLEKHGTDGIKVQPASVDTPRDVVETQRARTLRRSG